MRSRVNFPVSGIYSINGGIAGSHYLTDADQRRYRYVMPSTDVRPEYYVADFWIVDRDGNLNPGTDYSPVPFRRDDIGRRVGKQTTRAEFCNC